MRFPLRGPASVALALSLAACGGDGASNPLEPSVAPRFATTSSGKVRISEIHYDNGGTDVGEAIEITGPANTDLTGWSLVLYNGNGGVPYDTDVLTGALNAACGAEGVFVFSYPSNGIQNGSPDGVALVDAAGEVVEFLSYEGGITAASGPAAGMAATDIGASQTGSQAAGLSLQANGLGGWAVAPNTFGACNDQPPPPYDGPTTVVVSELMGDPLGAESASWGEWFEVHNYGTETVNLGGWTIETAGQPAHTIGDNVRIPAGGYVVLGRGADENRNGNVRIDYNYFTGGTTIWLDDADWLALRTPGPAVATIDSVKWSSLPKGATRGLRDPAADNADVDGANWGFATSAMSFGSGDYGTPGAPNGALAAAAPAVPAGIVRMVFSGRDVDDVKLPVGFEDQLFVTGYTEGRTDSVKTGFVWSSLTPALASVDQNGVVHALGEGDAYIRAVAPDGRVGIRRVPTHVATASGSAAYVGNTMFGVPTDGDPGDEFVFARAGFTYSYSPARNTPNWVSYDLEATHIGPEDRCDCFTHDPALPSGVAHLTTADYTGAGAAAGYGIDRGHLVRSSDRTAGSLDNAETFYFSNIVPQAADQNQGPWNDLEGFLNGRARTGSSEIYVVAGVAGSKGTLKNEGKVVIPQSTWKIAVTMPRDAGLSQIDAADDFELLVVDMPNEPGIRNVDWNTYRTTVDAVEAKTGYDLLALLPDHVEWLVEAGLTSPAAPAAQLLPVLSGGIRDLVAKGVLPKGLGDAFLAKLAEAQAYLAAGNTAEAAGAVRALSNQLRALVRGGQLTPAQVESIDIFAGWVLGAIH